MLLHHSTDDLSPVVQAQTLTYRRAMVADRREPGTALDHIGVRVRSWRLKRNLTQRVLADLAGLTQGYIAQIEAGTAPLDKRSTELALAKALQVSMADLTGQPYDPTTLRRTPGDLLAHPQPRRAPRQRPCRAKHR